MKRPARLGKIARQVLRSQTELAQATAYLVEAAANHSRVDTSIADVYLRIAEGHVRKARRGLELLQAEDARAVRLLDEALSEP